MMVLHVTVLDRHGNPIEGLPSQAFHVLEDGVEQRLNFLKQDDSPSSIGLVIDRSGSMSNTARAVNDAVLQFIKTTYVRDEFFLVDFNEHVEMISDAETLRARLNETTTRGRTALLDALYLGISQMRNAHNATRILVVITDGKDNDSRYTTAEVRSILKETDVQVYAAVITEPLGMIGPRVGPNEVVDMKGLCSLNGGEAFLVQDLKDLPSVLATISADLRKQYLTGYYSANGARNGKWRSLKIKVDVPPELRPARVFARSGYYGLGH